MTTSMRDGREVITLILTDICTPENAKKARIGEFSPSHLFLITHFCLLAASR